MGRAKKRISTINRFSDTLFCCTSGCMTVLVHREIKHREKAQLMEREENLLSNIPFVSK